MLALIICEAGNLDQLVKVVESDTEAPEPRLGIQPGESYKRSELLKWLLLQPANDVAAALARDNAGSVEAFGSAMNSRAQNLGMANTVFKSPTGVMDSGQHSTARDLALLAWACYEQPFIRDCGNMSSFSLKLKDGRQMTASNTNQLMKEQSYCVGLKHGESDTARNCLISIGQKEGRGRMVVVLGSTDSWIWRDSKVLLEWALRSD